MIFAYLRVSTREQNLDRQMEGIEAAKKKGKHLGRPKQALLENWNEVYEKWTKGEIKATEAMKALGMKKSSFYRAVEQMK